LRPDLSIRKGKYGAYIYYKNDKMDNPEFYPLKQYAKKWSTTDNAQLIAWIENTYHPGKPLGII
jgi:topoisomerase IA-like protein